ncbi:MAG: glycosyltransferase family 9 protein [Planctomycetota bacterium]|nr:glycosyltransferase family 9 protein [Planctomycetota bacterium]
MLPLRKWPQERYAALARRLAEELPDLCLLLTGAPDEAEPVNALAKSINHPRCLSIAGLTSLRQLLVLYGLAEVLVTNDSGPAHFAAITEIDVVSLFGPETPGLFAPQTPRSHVLWAGIACSPCVSAFNDRQSACTNNLCMQHITVDQVFAKVVGALRRRTDAAAAATAATSS